MISLWYQNKLLLSSSAYMHCCNEDTLSLVVLSEISEVRSVCFKPIVQEKADQWLSVA